MQGILHLCIYNGENEPITRPEARTYVSYMRSLFMMVILVKKSVDEEDSGLWYGIILPAVTYGLVMDMLMFHGGGI